MGEIAKVWYSLGLFVLSGFSVIIYSDGLLAYYLVRATSTD